MGAVRGVRRVRGVVVAVVVTLLVVAVVPPAGADPGGAVPLERAASSGTASARVSVSTIDADADEPSADPAAVATSTSPPPPAQLTQTAEPTHDGVVTSNGDVDLGPEVRPRRLDVGNWLGCAIRIDGTLDCFGQNNSHMPAFPPEGTFVSVAVGQQYGCALDADGAATCWGMPNDDRLVAPDVRLVDISIGFNHACGLEQDGTPHCWGWDGGFGATVPPDEPFVQIATGNAMSCGITPEQEVRCWGSNDSGQLQVPSGQFTELSAGHGHVCAIRVDRTLACWGLLSDAPLGAFRSVSAGWGHTCAIAVDHTPVCWGNNTGGRSDPPPGIFASISVWQHSCGVRFEGTVECWAGDGPARGDIASVNAHGLVCWIYDDGTSNCAHGDPGPWERVTTNSITYGGTKCGLRVGGELTCWGNNNWGVRDAPEGTFVHHDITGLHGCAIRTDQTIVCWGTDTNDRLDAPAGTYTTLATRNATTCAISTDGDLHCWGGTSNSATALHTPPAGTYTAVVVGGTYACAVATNGELDCWGSVGPGEPPAAPAGGFVDVVGSNQHACALATVGSVHCWGADHEGRSSPFPGTYDQIAGAHGSRTCARRVDGVGSCWGTIVVSGDPYVVQVDESPDLPDLAVWPGVIGDSGPVSLQVLGVSVELVSRVSLVRGGGHEHVAEAVLDGGVARTEARLVLDSIDQGSWDVLVQMADGSVVLIEDAVQVEEATGYDLYVRLSAPPMTRATFPSMVTVSVGNLGNTDARVVPVYLAGIPEAATLTGRFDLAELPAEPVPGLDGRLLPLDAVPVMVPDDRGTAMAPILVSNVPANSEVSFSMLVTVPEAGAPGGVPEFELSAWANACLGDLDLSLPETSDAADMAGAAGADRRSLAEIDALAECIVDGLALAVDVGLEFIPGGGCVKGGFGQFTKSQVAGAAAGATFNAMEQARTGEAVWGSWATTTIGSAVVDCAADIFPYTKALKVAKTVVTWGNRIIAGAELANDIAGGCMPETVAVPRTVTVMGAFDPNEKVGPPGVGEEGYTTPDVPFGYTIYFENDPEATAPALIVEITDEIDTTVFDPDTIRLGLITLSDELVITPPQGVREWSTTVDDPGSDDLIDIDVTWHDDTSELVWTMTAVDPDTGELPTDPLAGFLPPNVEPIEGEGSVSFVIEPRERTDGIVLSNAASIVFDNNEPIVTDAWVNTLDGTPPVGSVDPLPEVSTTTDLEVSWSAEDELSGVGGYQLLVSVDDGPLVTWFSVDDPTRTTATYEAERGRSYGFAVRAWDRAGNLEAVPVEPQAVTAVAPSLCFDDDGDGPFPDVGTSHPFCEAIEWLADEQITGGYGDGTFRPVAPISRQAMAAFLWRMAGSPEMSVDGDGPFPDVGLEHPFAEAIAWLADEGITGGYEDGTFRPVAPISRQAMAAFLWRMAGSPEMSVAGDGPFPDVGAGHPFAEAIAWLADEGITGGYDDGTFRPLEPISRQAMAAFLWRRAGFG